MDKTTSEVCWPTDCVSLTHPSIPLVEEFANVLGDATDERPLQTVLVKNPVLLKAFIPPCQSMWCFDRPRFGSEYIPDFLLCSRNSTGFKWGLVELESPTKVALKANGRMSAALTEAIGQVDDWRIWLRKNISYAQSELGFKEIDAECPAIIVIGRRAGLDPKHISRYRELSNKGLTVMTFDRLVDSARSLATK